MYVLLKFLKVGGETFPRIDHHACLGSFGLYLFVTDVSEGAFFWMFPGTDADS